MTMSARLATPRPRLLLVALTLAASAFAGMGLVIFAGGASPLEAACIPESAPVIQPGPLSSPLRLIAGPDGDYLVADYRTQRIYSVTPQTLDTPLPSFETRGQPLSLARIESNGRTCYLVGNDSARTIDLFEAKNGRVKPKKQWTTLTDIQPLDMAVATAQQRIYVVDGSSGAILALDYSGQPLTLAGSFAGLVTPKGIAVDAAQQRVIVSDYGDPALETGAKLVIYDLDGQQLGVISGGFSRPQGVTADNGRIFVVDAMLGQVLEYHLATEGLIATYGCFGSGPGHLLLPMDVVIDSPGQLLLVADHRNGRITPLPLTP